MDDLRLYKVLVLEDDADDMFLLERLFTSSRQWRFRIEHARTLAEAVRVIESTRIDVCLVDLTVPDSDGLETFLTIQSHLSDVPVVVLTGLDDEGLAIEALRRGAQDYIVKGQVDGQMLIRSVRYALERSKSEQALRESEERLRTLFETIQDAIFLTDETGCVDCNPAAARMFRCSRDELLGGFPSVLTPLGRQGRAGHVPTDGPRVSLRDAVPQTFEWVHRRYDGNEFPAEVTVAPMTLGGAPMLVSVVRDISERKAAEKERERLEAQLWQSQKLEAVGRLAGGIAHDFNNLLTVIIGYCNLLLKQLTPGDKLHHRVTQIHDAADRAASLTKQLLAFGRKQIFDVRTVALADVIDTLEIMLGRLIGEDIELTVECRTDGEKVTVDPGQLEQVIVNLAVNARDAMPRGGRLTISCSALTIGEEARPRGTELETGSYVKISVEDTGEGMREEILEQIFEPFFTTKELGKGTGLGLATVYGIIKQSGGDITVTSTLGSGTTFDIFLPSEDQ